MLKVEPLENHSWQKTSFLDFFEPFFPTHTTNAAIAENTVSLMPNPQVVFVS